jgi:mono/diheme cytochrome c family protein
MKSLVTVLFLVLIGIAAFVWAQGGSVEKGKALVESNHCAVCHKEPTPGKPMAEGVQGKPMEMVAGTNTDAFLKEGITNPKKVSGPKVKMPDFKLTDEQLQDIIAYLRAIAKH